MPKDACYHKVKARYKVFPSAYASGAIAKCRKLVLQITAQVVKRRKSLVYEKQAQECIWGLKDQQKIKISQEVVVLY